MRAGSKSTDQSWQFLQTAEDVVRFFIVLAWVAKPPVGDGDDAHIRRFRRGDAGKRVLNYQACVSGESKLLRSAQVDVGSGFAAFDFFASNNDLEESGQLMSDLKRVARTRQPNSWRQRDAVSSSSVLATLL